MIIKIEDAPSIKNIKIDISFEDGSTTISNTVGVIGGASTVTSEELLVKTTGYDNDIPLNLDENFDVSTEVVQKPEIPDIEREVKVSDDMNGEEF